MKLRDRIEFVAGRALAALPAHAQRRLLRAPPVRVDGQELDPSMQLLLAVRGSRGAPSLVPPGGSTPEDARRMIRHESAVHAGRRTEVGAVRDLTVASTLPARHYARPEGIYGDSAVAGRDPNGRAPLLVFFHGGGWVVGDVDTHDELCRVLCRFGGVDVLSVGYRLAPEAPFPAAVDDAFASVRWAAEHAAELGADPARIAVGGDSAGGNLAAIAAQRARDLGGPRIAAQLLIYPSVDWAERRPSRELFASGFFLTQADMDWCERHYVSRDVDRKDPRLSPLRAARLDGLPPAIVVTAAFDPLRDEGEAYVRALAAAGTPATLLRATGLIHGFGNMTAVSRPAREATIAMAGMLRQLLTSRREPRDAAVRGDDARATSSPD